MQNFSFKRLTAWIVTLMMLFTIIPINVSASAKDDLLSDITLYSQGKGNKKSSAAANSDTSATKGNNSKSTVTYGTDITASYDIAPQADETIYVLAGSDFQERGDHTASQNNVNDILTQISQKYTSFDGFLFMGDYDCESHNDANKTASGITALMGAVSGIYSNINYDNTILVQGNHDYKDSRIDATGGHDFNGYSAYVLNEDDYPDSGGTKSGIQALANNLKTWLNNKAEEQYSAPIFIVSHLPLAFTPRTNNRGDAIYAKYIFDVLNEAGAKGLNIIFMHGHDHAYGPDNYIGGEAIYLTKGDNINIAVPGSRTSWTEETLNFVYMNAGYVGYYSTGYDTTAGTDKLTMTVFAITDNQVTIERYSADGLYNLKSAGRDGYYNDSSVTASSLGLKFNTDIYASPQTISLTNVSTVTESGEIGKYVEASGFVDDVTTSGGKWVTVQEATNGNDGTNPTYQYVLDTDGIDYGSENKYIIVARADKWLLDAGNGVAINISDDGTTATTDSKDYEYYFTESNKLITRDGTNTLYQQNWNIHVGNSNGSNLNGFTKIGKGYYRIYDTVDTQRSLYWDGDSWTVTASDHENQIYSIRLYKFEKLIPGSDAASGTNGLYAYLNGGLSYEVSPGTSASDALTTVKNGITVRYTTNEDYSNVSEYSDDVKGLTWTLDSAYGNGTTPGDYAVTIALNGTVLGIAEVIVPATATYYIAEGNTLYTVGMNTSADDAMAAVKYGITVSSASDANGTNKTPIDDALVTWNWVDTYSGTNNGPYTVEILYNDISLGTVEVSVDVQYEPAIKGWTTVGTQSSGYSYKLDTNGIDYGENERYIIVAKDQPFALYAKNTSNGTAEPITISGDTATTTTRDYEYYFIISASKFDGKYYELITRDNGNNYLYHENNRIHYGKRASVKFKVTDKGNGLYDIHDIDGTQWYIMYDNKTKKWTATEDTSARVRLYKYTGEIQGETIYAKLEGDTTYHVTLGKSSTSALSRVKAGITGYTSNNAAGTDPTALDDSALTWKWLNTYNGNVEGSYWVEISYNGIVLGIVEVIVEPGIVNNYPEYPDEGAVKVSKSATGIDFQSSGIAQVEISASGVPIKKGADVIVMLDTSSSMTTNKIGGSDKTRAQVLEESLTNLIAKFKENGDDGESLDIRVAIADFNGFYGANQTVNGTPYDRDANDKMSDGIFYNASSQAKVYTGTGKLDAGAFIDASELASSYTLNYTSGTNYDYAMDAIYQLGTAIKESNGTEDRDLYVIFMSDGAAMQWNYYHSQGASSLWNSWITGAWTAKDLDANLDCKTHAYYYDEVDHDGDGMRNEHRMANAIKGDPSENFEVIRKTNTLGTQTGEANMYMVPGLGATMFSISFDAQQDTNVTADSMDKSIASLASAQTGTTQYYYKVTTAEELSHAFDTIGSEIAYAAINARFVDQMGDNFNLQMSSKSYNVVENNTTAKKPLEPVVEILTYDIYTRQDYLNGIITADKIGDRKGTSKLLEVVKFSEDGTKAYSNLIDVDKDGRFGVTVAGDGTYTINDTDDNILNSDGVIYAQTFLYNTKSTSVNIANVNIPTDITTAGLTTGSSTSLPAETFYWKLGTVKTTELAMRYYVYLDGSMEGNREAGSYPTNEFATLYYDNYLGNPTYKKTVSPTLAWKQASVSYAFYLVNDNGDIIVNQTTGQTGSFANKIAVTNPVVYDTIMLNNLDQIRSISVADSSVLPYGYELYDDNAVYTITINSNTTGCWEISQDINKNASTYVTQFDIDNSSAYSNALMDGKDEKGNYIVTGHDYTHTVVWFAVVWKVQALPDVVVIDYGLPVDISVLGNDMFGENGKLAGVGPYTDTLNLDNFDTKLSNDFGDRYVGNYGTATADYSTGKVRYELNTMKMDSYEKFAYAVHYTGSANSGYYYDTITVIPATTIYYEEKFVNFYDAEMTTPSDLNGTANGEWTIAGNEYNNAVQDEDRPGEYSLPNIDHNNIYGYDGINSSATTYSLGSAAKVTVDSNHDTIRKAPYAEFTFTGTGFDLISLTDNTSGTIAMRVWDANNNVVETEYIDNYYGYTYNDGIWTVDTSSTDCIWQVPVLKISDLGYGTYTVRVYVEYEKYFDHTGDSSYTFVLDSIRVYDPAGDGINSSDTTIHDAYVADGEAYPHYLMVKEAILGVDELENLSPDIKGTLKGAVFIDGMESTSNAADYSNPGPNNEAYLAPGQSISFKLNANTKPIDVQLGAKLAYGDSVDVQLSYNGSAVKTWTLKTATDMYYTIMQYLSFSDINASWTTGTITIANVSSKNSNSIVSLTNIKATFDSDTITVIGSDGYTPSANDETESVSKLSLRTASFATALAVDESTGTETTEEVQIAFLVDAETIDTACAVMTALYAPAPEVFVPEVLEYTVTPGFFRYDTVNVITSKDVASLTVNGMEATKLNDFVLFGSMFKLIAYFEDILGIDFSSNDYYIWTVSIKRADSYEIIAYNEDGLSSDPSVPDSASSITKDDITGFFDRSKVIGIMKELADRIFSPEHFETYINERLDGKREIITQTSEDVEYIVIDGKIVNRYITETVVDLGNDGAETVKRVWITEADDTSTDEEASVSVYNKNGVGSNERKPDHKKEESENHGDEKDIPQT